MRRQSGEKKGVSGSVEVTIHPSQFPECVRADLLESLRTRRINHKFHYDSIKQTHKWLELHQAYSPSRTDTDCEATYLRAFEAVCGKMEKFTNLIGLGCGGGQKDSQLLQRLRHTGAEVCYVPCDVSVAMVLTARETALGVLPGLKCHPVVCDLATAQDLPQTLVKLGVPTEGRLVTFFGMLPNFEPEIVLPRLAGFLASEDRLLLSANLAPGSDYDAGVRKILPLYDNPLTREWLMIFLTDLGVEREDGELLFGIETSPLERLVLEPRDVPPHPGPLPKGEGEPFGGAGKSRGPLNSPARSKSALSPWEEGRGEGKRDLKAGVSRLKRVVANFRFVRARSFSVGSEEFNLRPGDNIGLFFSYRHTPEIVRKLTSSVGLRVLEQWLTRSGEEGVFLLERAG